MYTCMPYRLICTHVHHTRSNTTTAFTFSHHQHWGAGARRKFPIIGRCGCSGCCPQALILITRNEPAALVSMKHAPTMVGPHHQEQAIIISAPRRSSEPISNPLSRTHAGREPHLTGMDIVCSGRNHSRILKVYC